MKAFDNGLIYLDKVGEANVDVHLIPESNTTSRPGYPMQATTITVHNTGNKNADAEDHTEYVDNTTAYVSWHFTVDDKDIFQELPINETAWHAGDGRNGPGNRTSVAIEICEHDGINWNMAKYNGIKLIVLLLNELGLSPEAVVPHKEWSGKYCPHRILDEGWDGFIDLIKKEYKASQVPAEQEVSPWAQEAWDWAVEKGINDGKKPKAPVTEEQVMVFLYNYHNR